MYIREDSAGVYFYFTYNAPSPPYQGCPHGWNLFQTGVSTLSCILFKYWSETSCLIPYIRRLRSVYLPTGVLLVLLSRYRFLSLLLRWFIFYYWSIFFLFNLYINNYNSLLVYVWVWCTYCATTPISSCYYTIIVKGMKIYT